MKSGRSLVLAFIVGAVAVGTALLSNSVSSNETKLTSRTNDELGVRVVVTPKTLAPGAAAWEFEVIMDTHTKPLTDDLVRAAVMVDENGRQYAPLSWQGDGPGGHHRKGLLRFAAPGEQPKTVELQLTGVGGSGKRIFSWELK